MAPRDAKYGSSYDPRNFGGKVDRQMMEKRERERQEREREQHKLRGCGDPNCPMCNPETAFRNRGAGMPNSPFITLGGSGAFSRDEIIQAMEEVSSFISGGGRTERVSSSGGVPASYAQARKAVADWLVPTPTTEFTDIIGNDEALGQLRDAIQAPVKYAELYGAYGMKMPKGALLSGPPGCGKTMFAKAAAAEMRRLYGGSAEFLSISGSSLQSMFVGETEQRIMAIFKFAREYRAYHGHPLLVFMDEAEVMLPDRTGRVRRVASWEESQVATFLAEMDGMQDSGAFVLLATNRPEVIDQAVLRDGRCDFKITVKRPSKEALEGILSKGFAGILKADDVSIDQLVFAALESFMDPHKVILEAHMIGASLTRDGQVQTKDLKGRSFLLEHIVSGAIAEPGQAVCFLQR